MSALLLLVVHLSMDTGRAQLAVYPGRTSAVKAWWRGCQQIRARFLAHLGLYAAFTVAGLLVALAVTALRIARLVGLVDLAQARREAGL